MNVSKSIDVRIKDATHLFLKLTLDVRIVLRKLNSRRVLGYEFIYWQNHVIALAMGGGK